MLSVEKSISVKNNIILLDASALLASILKESGAKQVDQAISTGCVITLTNLAEVVTVMTRKGYFQEDIDALVKTINTQNITKDIASLAGQLETITHIHGLSLGDRVCLATGLLYNMEILTADKVWKKLKLPDVTIKLIR